MTGIAPDTSAAAGLGLLAKPTPPTISERVEQLQAGVDAMAGQLQSGDGRMERIEVDIASLRAALADLLEFIEAMKGALKVLNWLGRLARPLGYIAAAGTACLGLWAALRGHKP